MNKIKTELIKMTVDLPKDIKESIEAICTERGYGTSRNSVVRELIEEGLTKSKGNNNGK